MTKSLTDFGPHDMTNFFDQNSIRNLKRIFIILDLAVTNCQLLLNIEVLITRCITAVRQRKQH